MARFFAAGGFGLFPVSLFGLFTVAAAVLFLLRPERRFVAPMIALGPLSQGIAESLHVLVLALVLRVIAGLIASAGTLRAARAPALFAG